MSDRAFIMLFKLYLQPKRLGVFYLYSIKDIIQLPDDYLFVFAELTFIAAFIIFRLESISFS
jgi:hypothetical protein